jgi:hypothetical protein
MFVGYLLRFMSELFKYISTYKYHVNIMFFLLN